MITTILMIYAGWNRSWKIVLAIFLLSLAIQVFIVVPQVTENRLLLGLRGGNQNIHYLGALIEVSIGAVIWFAVGYIASAIRNRVKSKITNNPDMVLFCKSVNDCEKPSIDKQKSNASGTVLTFKSGEAAFEYTCKYMDNTVSEGIVLPALVIDAAEMFGVSSAVKQNEDGSQLATIKVASDDGGFIVIANTLGNGPVLQVGEFVAWHAGTFNKELADAAEDKRTGWVGVIVGTLEPIWEKEGWVGKAAFR